VELPAFHHLDAGGEALQIIRVVVDRAPRDRDLLEGAPAPQIDPQVDLLRAPRRVTGQRQVVAVRIRLDLARVRETRFERRLAGVEAPHDVGREPVDRRDVVGLRHLPRQPDLERHAADALIVERERARGDIGPLLRNRSLE